MSPIPLVNLLLVSLSPRILLIPGQLVKPLMGRLNLPLKIPLRDLERLIWKWIPVLINHSLGFLLLWKFPVLEWNLQIECFHQTFLLLSPLQLIKNWLEFPLVILHPILSPILP